MKDLYLPPLNLETNEDKERFSKKLRGELPSYNGTANYRLFVSTAVNPNFYSKAQESNEKRSAAAKREHGRWRVEANRVRQGPQPPTEKWDIAELVRKRLNLSHSVETIRKEI
jgi:hypothetical protein